MRKLHANSFMMFRAALRYLKMEPEWATSDAAVQEGLDGVCHQLGRVWSDILSDRSFRCRIDLVAATDKRTFFLATLDALIEIVAGAYNATVLGHRESGSGT